MSTQPPATRPSTPPRKPTPAERRRADKNARQATARAEVQARVQRRRTINRLLGVLGVVVIAAVVVGIVAALGGFDGKPAPKPSNVAIGPQPSPAWKPSLPAGVSASLQVMPQIAAGTGTVSQLKVTTLVQGDGPVVKKGDSITVNYIGATYKDGKVFDSSWGRAQTTDFTIGEGQVIPGWDQGLVGLKVGTRVQLDIPAALAYGTDASSGQPVGDLRFVVDILATTTPSASPSASASVTPAA